MTPERHQRIKDLFLAACQLDDTSRIAFLDHACSGDPELRAEVESLLAHHSPATLIEPAGVRAESVRQGTTVSVHLGGEVEAGTVVEVQDEPRFAPGSMIGGRYRIIALLGRGGMGEVYRAHDQRLGRDVALKFVVPSGGWGGAALARFYQEARAALAVTHPNVCRMYDLGDSAGEPFISMEYVDGETLRSLLRRVGRVPPERAIELTRQLCAALAAAHSAGILHCDLKPANVMIDGRGRVRLTDFGIAVAAEHARGLRGAGTRGYIAPEVLGGSAPSVRSDIYALGLVLYELFTGHKANADEASGAGPLRPSELVEGIPPEIEHCILQCFASDPSDRPASVFEIRAAFSGGDALHAALAAGETPTPELVIAAGSRGTLRSGVAMATAGIAMASLAALILLADRTCLLSGMALDRSPHVLREQAGQIAAAVGGGSARDVKSRFLISHDTRAEGNDGTQRPTVVFEWTCDSHTADAHGSDQRSRSASPIRLILDAHGNLRSYRRIPGPLDTAMRPEPDWAAIVRMAGLSPDSLEPVQPVPPAYAAAQRAWTAYPISAPDHRVRIEAGAIGDRLVYFDVLPNLSQVDAGAERSLLQVATLILFLITLPPALFLARRNLRSGKGDRRGAWRLAVLLCSLDALVGLLGHRDAGNLLQGITTVPGVLSMAVFVGLVGWVYYVALEPYVRRFWPLSIVSWTRVLAGRWADPLVGRDVLIGATLGLGLFVLRQSAVLLEVSLVGPSSAAVLPPSEVDLGDLMGFGHTFAGLVHATRVALGRGIMIVMLMLLLRLASGSQRVAAVALLVALTSACLLAGGSMTMPAVASCALLAAGLTLVLVRAGVLALVVCLFTMHAISSGPITSNLNTWYAGSMAYTLLVPLLLLLAGLRLVSHRSETRLPA